MKFNKWTLGLAAVGAVSLASVVNAEEKAPTFLETAVSGTQISGYVNTSAHWNFNKYTGTGSAVSSSGYDSGKKDGFNLDAVVVTISKPLDETEWASGYKVEIAYGQDAASVGMNDASEDNNSIKQAYVTLRTPLGNGIDWKIGVWDTILGYEVFDSGNNPNYTRSYGYGMEPTSYAGVLASYKFCDVVSASAGVANVSNGGGTVNPVNRSSIDSRKTYVGSVALTAPESWGFLAGSTAYGAVAYGAGVGNNQNNINWYAGAVLNTGVKGLKVGAAYDYAGNDAKTGSGAIAATWNNAVAVYASFQATEKLSVHARGEYAWSDIAVSGLSSKSVYALTGTVQYDLWKNVLSRAEIRWDRANGGDFGPSNSSKDAVLLAANIIYKF